MQKQLSAPSRREKKEELRRYLSFLRAAIFTIMPDSAPWAPVLGKDGGGERERMPKVRTVGDLGVGRGREKSLDPSHSATRCSSNRPPRELGARFGMAAGRRLLFYARASPLRTAFQSEEGNPPHCQIGRGWAPAESQPCVQLFGGASRRGRLLWPVRPRPFAGARRRAGNTGVGRGGTETQGFLHWHVLRETGAACGELL